MLLIYFTMNKMPQTWPSLFSSKELVEILSQYAVPSESSSICPPLLLPQTNLVLYRTVFVPALGVLLLSLSLIGSHSQYSSECFIHVLTMQTGLVANLPQVRRSLLLSRFISDLYLPNFQELS